MREEIQLSVKTASHPTYGQVTIREDLPAPDGQVTVDAPLSGTIFVRPELLVKNASKSDQKRED